MSETNGYATKDDLFARLSGRREADYEVEGIGKVRLQSLNDLEKSELDAAAINNKGRFNRRAAVSANARLIQKVCINPRFTVQDVDRLQELDGAAIERLAKACNDHCGFGEEPEKNSDTTASDDSPTSSHATAATSAT